MRVVKDPKRLLSYSEDLDQTMRMHKLICVFDGITCSLVGYAVPRLISKHSYSRYFFTITSLFCLSSFYLGCTMRKRFFGYISTAKAQIPWNEPRPCCYCLQGKHIFCVCVCVCVCVCEFTICFLAHQIAQSDQGHYENEPIHIYWKFYHQKWNFSDKNSVIFNISAQNIHCGYSWEPPLRGGSNEYPQSMFLSRNKKNNIHPCKPQFYYIKVGFKGGQHYIGMFSWWPSLSANRNIEYYKM